MGKIGSGESILDINKKSLSGSNQTDFFPLFRFLLMDQEQPVVEPQVMHLRQVPLRIIVMLPHSVQESPV